MTYPSPDNPGHQQDHGFQNFSPFPYRGGVKRSVRPNVSAPKGFLPPVPPAVLTPENPYPQGYGITT